MSGLSCDDYSHSHAPMHGVLIMHVIHTLHCIILCVYVTCTFMCMRGLVGCCVCVCVCVYACPCVDEYCVHVCGGAVCVCLLVVA